MKNYFHLLAVLAAFFCMFSCTKEVPAELNVTTTELSFTKDGGSQSISFSTNKDWTASSSESWVQVPSSGTNSTTSIPITVEANKGEDRTAIVTIIVENLTKTVVVKQENSHIYFKDKLFKACCVGLFDTNKDGEISILEASVVKEIYLGNDVFGDKITSLEGIEFFTSITYLQCAYQSITSLDVSKNTLLTKLVCHHNQLTSLDVSNNTALMELYCGNNQLTSLDVSKNTALTELYCDNNQLTSLDVSKNTMLNILSCYANQLASIDISNNTALTRFSCYANQLTSINVCNNTELTVLFCNNNQLTSLDVSNNKALSELDCNTNHISSLNVSNNSALTTLNCAQNIQLASLNISNATSLTTLYCYSDSYLDNLDVSSNTALETLDCHDCLLGDLDVSNNSALNLLNCVKNPKLKELWIKTGQTIQSLSKDDHTVIKYKD